MSIENDLPGSLTMEQEFKLKVVKEQVKGLSLEQAQEYVVEMMKQMMLKDNLVKELLKNAWKNQSAKWPILN